MAWAWTGSSLTFEEAMMIGNRRCVRLSMNRDCAVSIPTGESRHGGLGSQLRVGGGGVQGGLSIRLGTHGRAGANACLIVGMKRGYVRRRE